MIRPPRSKVVTRLLLALSLMLGSFPGLARADVGPTLGRERVIFHTGVGDLVVALFPEIAPRTSRRFLEWVRLGIYDGLPFYAVLKGFFLQTSVAIAQKAPLALTDLSEIGPIPVEPSNLESERGLLAIQNFNAPAYAGASFVIFLSKGLHVDPRDTTIFGKIEQGFDVLSEMENVSTSASLQPLGKISIDKAEVVDSAAEAARMTIRGPSQSQSSPWLKSELDLPSVTWKYPRFVIWIMTLVGCLGFVFSGRLSSSVHASLGLTTALLGGFILVAESSGHALAGIAVLLGSIGAFKVIPRPTPKK